MKNKKPERLARSVIYESSWVSLYTDKVELPAGRIIEKHHIIDFTTQAVGVVVENEKGEILFVHVYRYALNDVIWEIPAGRIEKGESPIEAAQREVKEESGYETSNHKLVYSFCPIIGISDEAFHIVFCLAGERTGEYDKNEIQAVKWLPKEKIKQMIQNKELIDGFSFPALLLYFSDLVNRDCSIRCD